MEDISYYDSIINHFILFNISFNLERKKTRKKEKNYKKNQRNRVTTMRIEVAITTELIKKLF
jgi:hypothetical protein